MKMWLLNAGKPVKVPSLNEAMAIDLGANILGEAVIFVVAATLLCLEYFRQTRKEERKEEMRKEELSTLNYTIQELYFQLERHEAQIRELHRTVADFDKKVIVKPWSPKSSTSPSQPSAPLTSSIPSVPPNLNLNTDLGIKLISPTKHHLHLPHRNPDLIPMHLEHINKVVADNRGIVLTAVSYLTHDIFNLKNNYYSDIHLQR